MANKTQNPPNPTNIKLILFCIFLIFMLFFILMRSTFLPWQQNPVSHASSAPNPTSKTTQLPLMPSCNKIAPSLAETLIHYATSNTTPQQTLKEVSVTARVLAKKSPCNFLVFGLGLDSPMWAALNHGGRTVFLEEDEAWIQQVQSRLPNLELESHHVAYDTRVEQAEQLFQMGMGAGDCREVRDPRFSKCGLAHKGFPAEVYEVEWDVMMVDAPTGYHEAAPGRMTAIYTAGLMGRNREEGETHVMVHDVDRGVEDKFSKGFLCEGYLTEQEGRLRHFTIPSHRTRSGRPFCPTI